MQDSILQKENEEVWKDVVGFEGYYQISNHGRIRSVDRIYAQKSRHGTVMEKKYAGKLMAQSDNGHGYKIVSLRKQTNKRKNYYIHRLVAEAFIPNPNGYKEINHIDYDKSNNSVNNLEWVSRKKNVIYSADRMRKPHENVKSTSTGEKYITKKKGKWRLNIQRRTLRYDKLFNSLKEAVFAREVLIGA